MSKKASKTTRKTAPATPKPAVANEAPRRGRPRKVQAPAVLAANVIVPLFVALPPEQAAQVGNGLVLTPADFGQPTDRFSASLHPMRRVSDTVATAAAAPAPRATVRAAAPRLTGRGETSGAKRGRVAGRYVSLVKPTAVKGLKMYTESMQKIHKLIADTKEGRTMRDVIAKLNMPQGTVGWALRVLMQQKVIGYNAATATEHNGRQRAA